MSREPPPWNRTPQQSEAIEAEGGRLLNVQVQRFAAVEQRLADGALRAGDGSTMYYDDRIEDYQPPSMQCTNLINIAVDHLKALRSFVSGTDDHPGVLPTVAGYALLRSVVEACALGLWLRSSSMRAKRVFGSLTLLAKNRLDARQFAEPQGLLNEVGLNNMMRRLEAIRDSTGYKDRDLTKFPLYSDIVGEASKSVPKRLYTPLEAWRAMSGMAHANVDIVRMLSEQQRGKDEFIVTTSTYLFAQMLTVSLDCLTALIDLYEQQSTNVEPQWKTKRGRR